MASAKPGILLALSHDEASALQAVLARVAGHPATSRRGLIDPIFKELEKSGIRFNTKDIPYADAINFQPLDGSKAKVGC